MSHAELSRAILLIYMDIEGDQVYANNTNLPHRYLDENNENIVEWVGAGDVAEISTTRQDSDGGDYTFTVSLNNLPSTVDIENINYRGRDIVFYLAQRDENYQITSREIVVVGRMNQMSLTEGKDNRVSIECEAGLGWDKTSPRKNNNEWQQLTYPDDEALKYMGANVDLVLEI